MIIPVNQSILELNAKENTINELVKYSTLEQKVYFILLAKFNMYKQNNVKKECSVSFIEIKKLLNVKGKLPNTKIKKAVIEITKDRENEIDLQDDGVVIDSMYIPHRVNTHLLNLEPIMKCKSINQIKMLIILSCKTSKYFYRNFSTKILGLDVSDFDKKSKATDTVKRLCKSLKENGIISEFNYNPDNKKFSIKHTKNNYVSPEKKLTEENVTYLKYVFDNKK